ncbi:MAG: glutamate--tRNA ligase [Hyphomicrobiaceae bacterium]
MTVTVRFAPSPTGRLHIGNIRTALLNWLYAARENGTFILRLDDTDRERSTPEFADAIRQDLTWLGLVWDQEASQSQRLARYADVAERLKQSGRLYPCYESEEELDRRRSRQRARGLPPIYDRTGLRLSPEERHQLEQQGRRPHWRFRLDNSSPETGDTPQPTLVAWLDLIRNDQTVDIGSLSDPVLIREDGTPLYTFTSVIDDIDMDVTHVIRGEDHVTNTGVQIDLFRALGAEPPRFAHHSLLVSADGQALSKRLGALSIANLRDDGIEPMTVASHAALLGTPEAITVYPDLATLAQHCELERVSRSPGRFDLAELETLNSRYLTSLHYDDVRERLDSMGISGGASFWEAVKGNLTRFADAHLWWQITSSPITPAIENEPLLAEAVTLLPAEPWDENTFATWTAAIRKATGTKGRQLFHPLRLALTGKEAGPELKALLPLMGRNRVEARLQGREA